MAENDATARLEALWGDTLTRLRQLEEEKTGVPATQWRAGGRATKANPDKENHTWWEANGLRMLNEFNEWWTANGAWTIWRTPIGEPAVEVGLFADLGGVPVRAYADLIAYDNDGVLSVIDFKTGSYMPDSGMQLGLYATLVETLFGVRPQRGYYYDARNAQMIPAPGMERWTPAVFTHLFQKFAAAIDAELFMPNVGMSCKTCGVKDYCYANGGSRSQGVDPLSTLGK